jgi:hypothetical protein
VGVAVLVVLAVIFAVPFVVYSLLWFVMFSIGEVGHAIGPGYSWTEAAGGFISEALYCPLSAYFTWRLLGRKAETALEPCRILDGRAAAR